MKKGNAFLSFLLMTVLMIMPAITANATSSDVDTLFKNSYDSVKKVITIANENHVNPYYFKPEGALEVGVSESENVANASSKGMQLAIYDARKLIDQLPDSLIDYKRTFSSILDNYQHPIYERIVFLIDNNQQNPKQKEINWARILIKNVPDFFKSSYSVALDNLQGKLFAKANQLVDKALLTKKSVDIDNAVQILAELKSILKEFSSSDIDKFIQSLEEKINNALNNYQLTVKDISKKTGSVVTIITKDINGKELATGCGFITSEIGEIVTNYHIIKGAYSAIVKTEGGASYNVKGVLGANSRVDIAVLKLENASNLQALQIGNSDAITTEDDVVAIGSPIELKNTTSSGIINKLGVVSDNRSGKDIQFTLMSKTYNFSGALLNMNGQVIGLIYSGNSETKLGSAIPINEIRNYLGLKVEKPLPEFNKLI
jgi:S1-C subfamily serine protease